MCIWIGNPRSRVYIVSTNVYLIYCYYMPRVCACACVCLYVRKSKRSARAHSRTRSSSEQSRLQTNHTPISTSQTACAVRSGVPPECAARCCLCACACGARGRSDGAHLCECSRFGCGPRVVDVVVVACVAAVDDAVAVVAAAAVVAIGMCVYAAYCVLVCTCI